MRNTNSIPSLQTKRSYISTKADNNAPTTTTEHPKGISSFQSGHHQGSITALTDSEGNIVESFLYDEAYGTILDHYKRVETYNPYCYTGRELDSQDLYYYRARYYDPSVGRFISSDPIEFLAGDTNFYRYVGGDPVNFVDPSGLCGEGLCIGGVAIGAWDLLIIGAGLTGIISTRQKENLYIHWDDIFGSDDVVMQSENTNIEVEVDTAEGINVEDLCGKKGTYKDMKKNPSEAEGVKFERDHMASGGAIKKFAKKAAKGIVKLTECMMNILLDEAFTIMMPKSDHAKSDTYKGNNTDAKTSQDAEDLNKAKLKDREKMKEHLNEERKKTEEKEGDSKETKKEKKKRRDCIDAILEALNSKEFLEFDTEQMIKDKIKEFKENADKINNWKNGNKKKCAKAVE